jgi:hypothetical protein
MKVVANYTIFYGAEFLKESVKSIYKQADKIQIAVGLQSWKNHKGIRFGPIDNTIEVAENLDDPDNKIVLYKGIWDSDTEQRNFLLDKCIGEYDYAMLIDSDEVWEEDQLKGLLDYAKEDLERFGPVGREKKVIAVGIIHYFKSLYWGYKGETQKVNYLFRADGSVRHEWIRHPGVVDTGRVDVYYHHYGYAYPSEIIKKKIAMWGHSGEVAETWYKNIYLPWKPNDGQAQAWSPTGDLWEPLIKREIIPIMAKHRLAGKEYYD